MKNSDQNAEPQTGCLLNPSKLVAAIV
jgi:hypothetical protein